MRKVRAALAGAVLLHAGLGVAQTPDQSRLRRPGERRVVTPSAPTDENADFDPQALRDPGAVPERRVDAQIQRDSNRALGHRIDVSGNAVNQRGAELAGRRLNSRVLGRVGGRLSTRITGTQVGDAEVTDGVRNAQAPR